MLKVLEKPFTAIGPIYFEYGSLIITFNTPKAATAAVQKLQNRTYDEKKLIVLCLPNVQVIMSFLDKTLNLGIVNLKVYNRTESSTENEILTNENSKP